MQMSKLAEKLGIDRSLLRARQLWEDGSELPTQTVVPAGVGIGETLKQVTQCAGWSEQGPQRPPASAPHKRTGVGLACGGKNVGYSFGFPEQATSTVQLFGQQHIDRAVVKIAAAEVGQGTTTVLAQIAAQTLGIPYGKVEIPAIDTADVPNAGSSSASRQTLMSGNAVKGACERALEAWKKGDRPVQATYQYLPPRTTPYDPDTGECYPNFGYGYGSQIVEVEVDMETGEIVLTRVIASHDPGAIINPQAFEGQVEGGVVMAQGWTLIEDFVQQEGLIKTRRFSELLIPTSVDAPSLILQCPVTVADPLGPYGARGVGEMTMMLLAPAILDAIHDATGIWFNKIPVKAEDVLLALKHKASALRPA
jgi:CO/xanthine dehydrogenase Mo-binding subunit